MAHRAVGGTADQHAPWREHRSPRISWGAAPWGATERRNTYGRRFHATAAGSRSPFRPPDAPMEPEDEPLHSGRAQRDLSHRPTQDPHRRRVRLLVRP